jgi:crossover junction endodeoxyribonuclease RusA
MRAITVTLPPAVSANVYWRTRVAGKRAMTYVSAEAKAFKAEVQQRLRAVGLTAPISGRVAVTLFMYPHRPLDWQRRQRQAGAAWDDSVRSIDLDNAIKVTLDAMKGLAFDDDVWVRQIHAARMEPDGEARVVVTITPIETAQPQGALI